MAHKGACIIEALELLAQRIRKRVVSTEVGGSGAEVESPKCFLSEPKDPQAYLVLLRRSELR